MAKKKQVGIPFKKGDDSRRNTTGANKGSKWKSTLLKDLMTIDLSKTEIETFDEFSSKFPGLFNSTPEKNFQLYMEIKQISLVFNKNPNVSQNAINAIKDRIQGKPTQIVDIGIEDKKKMSTDERRARIHELTEKAKGVNESN
ncbi:MAG: hypothetical protein MK105_15130 [Crocinitomicaceae bacterium]|nr:hypothetical protein [Crocinitomicaceae bacterium]